MKRPFWLLTLLITLSLLALFGGALAVEQLPLWTAPRFDWMQRVEGGAIVSGDAPAACEAADLLARYDGRREGMVGDRVPHLIAARGALDDYGVQPADTPIGYGNFILAWEGRRARVALVTHSLIAQNANEPALMDRPMMAGMVLIDADTNAILGTWIIPGGSATTPADACPFDVRGALIDLVRSRPFIALVILIGLVVVIGSGALLARGLRKRRKGTHGTAALVG